VGINYKDKEIAIFLMEIAISIGETNFFLLKLPEI